MERRDFLKIAFGVAAGAAPFGASAAPLVPQPITGGGRLPAGPDAHPAVTTGDEVDHLKPQEVYWHRHWGWRRRHWGWRRRYWRRRYWRHRYWRRRHWRRHYWRRRYW